MQNKYWYRQGLRDGIPIALGYFAVSFALGITARRIAGLSAFQAALASFLLNASAGEYAGFTQIGANAPYLIAAAMVLIANARYLLMSCALSQKLDPKLPFFHRFLIAFDVTDELFAISVSVKGKLNPFYNYGAMTVSIPCWTVGTALGVLTGDILPARIVSALGVGLYGMFIAIVVPQAKKSRIITVISLISMALSYIFAKVPFLKEIDSGLRIIIITVVISLAAAVLFPVPEEAENPGDEDKEL